MSEPPSLQNEQFAPSEADLNEIKEKVIAKVEKKQVLKAVKALFKHVKAEKVKLQKSTKKKELFEEEEEEMDAKKVINYETHPIERNFSRCYYLVFSLNKVKDKFIHTLKGRRIEVPFPFQKLSNELDICMLTTETDESKLKEIVKHDNNNLKGVKRVLTRQKVLKIYPSSKKKKDLSMLHDIFLVDTRIAQSMPATLGKYFLKGSKQFRTVRLISKDYKYIPDYLPRDDNQKPTVTEDVEELRENIKYAIEGTYFYPRGSCATIKVGRFGMKETEVYENIVSVIAGVAGWNDGFENILSVSLKTGNSLALPLFSTLPDLKTLKEDDKIDENDSRTLKVLKRRAITKERKEKRRKLLSA